MKTLMKTLLLTAAVAMAYPAMAADPAPARPMRADITKAEYLKHAEARFDALDANKDGKITAEERAAKRPGRGMGHGAKAPAEMTKEQHMKYAEQRFDALDANKDGKVTAEERRTAHRANMQKRADCMKASAPDCRGQHRMGPRASVPAAHH